MNEIRPETRRGSGSRSGCPNSTLPAHEQLAADLLRPRHALDSSGRRVVEPKSETKRRLRRSPDRSDAAVMAFAVDLATTPMRTALATASRYRPRPPKGFVGKGKKHVPDPSLPELPDPPPGYQYAKSARAS